MSVSDTQVLILLHPTFNPMSQVRVQFFWYMPMVWTRVDPPELQTIWVPGSATSTTTPPLTNIHLLLINHCDFKPAGAASSDDSVLSPPPSVTESFGVSVALTARILNSPSSDLVPPELGGSSSGASNVAVFVILSIVLVVFIGGGIWFICFKGRRRREGDEYGHRPKIQATSIANEHGDSPPVRPLPSAPPPIANGRGGGKSVPAQPPAAPPMANNRRGGGSVPAQPSAAPQMPNDRRDNGSVPAQPPALPIETIRRDRRGGASSMEQRARSDLPLNVSSHPARHMENASSSIQMPLRVADIGLIAYSYKELRDATGNFSETNFLGEGGFARVYKGSLSSNRKVAVKLLKNENSKAEREFRNEVNIMSRIRHINIVSLIGYCITETKRLIVYEFVENKSLHDHLHGGNNLQSMDWLIRMKIAQGAAKGLAYLHGDCGPQNIIHRDVKPANILLDSSFVAKVADFGIAKLCPKSFDSYFATYVIGSVGFIDPFYYETKELSFKSDVYSFGIVLLELISGETHLPRVQKLKNELPGALESRNFVTIADPKLKRYNLDEMALMVTCVEACLRKDPKDRPQMILVSQVLEKIISADKLKMRTRPNRGF